MYGRPNFEFRTLTSTKVKIKNQNLFAELEGVSLLHQPDVEGAAMLEDGVQMFLDDGADLVHVAAPDGVHEVVERLGVRFDAEARLSLQIWKGTGLNLSQLDLFLRSPI